MPELEAYSQLSEFVTQAQAEIESADTEHELECLRVLYFGKKSHITALAKSIGKLATEDRPAAGKNLSQARTQLQAALDGKREQLRKAAFTARLLEERIDVTLPGRQRSVGGPHPLSRTMIRMQEIFSRIGFDVAVGPEIEDDYHNFEALNIPPDHPARAMQDTFYFHDEMLLRTHTSPVQIRYMKANKPPIRVVAPGRVYRCDSDITHTPMFHQLEGLVVDETTTFADLKGVLEFFVAEFLKRISSCVFARRIFRLPNHQRKWTSVVCFATVPDAMSARELAGSRYWVAAWCIPPFIPTSISMRNAMRATPLEWAWSDSPCFGTVWTIYVSFSRMIWTC